MTKFAKYGSAPVDGRIIFTDPTREHEWENLPESVKSLARASLKEHATSMTNQAAIEMLCHVVNELIVRVDKLEKSQTQHNS